MASTVYPLTKQALLSGTAIDLTAANIKAALIDTGAYTYSATHDFLDDVAVGSRIATSGNLASKTVTNGVFDAADVTFTAVSGASVEAIIVYIDTGTASTSRLLAYIDDTAGGDTTVTPNGGDITVTWNASGIFSL
jgi:hypothetical protein